MLSTVKIYESLWRRSTTLEAVFLDLTDGSVRITVFQLLHTHLSPVASVVQHSPTWGNITARRDESLNTFFFFGPTKVVICACSLEEAFHQRVVTFLNKLIIIQAGFKSLRAVLRYCTCYSGLTTLFYKIWLVHLIMVCNLFWLNAWWDMSASAWEVIITLWCFTDKILTGDGADWYPTILKSDKWC